MDDDIIKMAQEAGLRRQQYNLLSNPQQYRFSYDGYEENLKRFAALVRADEREACARVCDEFAQQDRTGYGVAEDCAVAIRARGGE